MALAKIRFGTAPIHLQTGRYQHLPVTDRTCVFGCPTVETEAHVLVECPLLLRVYEELRADVWNIASALQVNFLMNWTPTRNVCA